MDIRIGFGVDVHRLEEGREFWLGGLKLPSSFGAVGHSDADVLIHAVCDALLGALNLRDIGFHFSDTDPKYKGIDSKILLKNVMKLIKGKGFSVVNIDATVILEKPKVNPHIPQMQEILSGILEVETDRVSIKATTHEKVDSFGAGEAVKAYAVCLVSGF
ncbi:2-C-methyl-D-erythritol 2,4-cyclodiphosphate synthase [Fluviicola sp.]|jgi:2-C-methyl-D-erythritol 2,4-cyclodiphosphate synthase|uniref:2-C-methyl-D-erythritol 2,4-cyclodiphosphate synthase n=1 Tax=Fluviicola sp. TaxID=1917219 RepID=UPI002818C596|nr:2-C-methyl-D-erythritol 2,4-cyclodiphosphate synthase [Fluviicola sp.]MDR0802432.1 2-C-methyl-D-erythritol 2,4-cyclodiphosphate synthase [Fluviicola sp.]